MLNALGLSRRSELVCAEVILPDGTTCNCEVGGLLAVGWKHTRSLSLALTHSHPQCIAARRRWTGKPR
jgi:hypothetical protein